MNLYRRNGFLYAFEGYYLTSFAAAPAGDARSPGFWRGGGAHLGMPERDEFYVPPYHMGGRSSSVTTFSPT